ncbi:MAG: rod shape-determining protein [Oscillospiraceae bacterium]|jgi:rod shape-determining protein MreB|nr:rod shape-determining protein [Oscillospiraceae bacterium]
MFTDIGLDFGTASTVICAGRQVVLNEPTAVSLDTQSGRPLKFGSDAFAMVGKTPDSITAVLPVEHGVIANYDAAEHLLRYFLKKVSSTKMVKPRVLVSIPAGVTAVQRRSIMDALQSAGARTVCLIESPVAAAVGIGVDFSKPHGTIIVDIGAGTTDVAVLSLGGLAQCESIRIGGGDFDEAIIRYVRKEYNILIGNKTAEDIKKQIGCVTQRPIEIAMKAKGRNLFTGLPQIFEITTNEVCAAVTDVSYGICNGIQGVMENTPPELVGDIAGDGMILTGGGSLIHGMNELLTRYTGIKANVVDDPFTCVARGAGKALDNLDLLKNGDYEFRTLQDLMIT